jgi:D-amino-acid dehydrogenase
LRSCEREAAERGFHALMELSRASLELFESLVRRPDLHFFYQRKGLLHVYLSERGFARAQKEGEMLQRVGFGVRLLSRQETLQSEPALSPRICGGLFVEGEAHANCFEYTQSIASDLSKRGVRIVANRAVSRIIVKGGRVAYVVTSLPTSRLTEEELPCELVVIAAGAWTPRLAASVGIRIPIQAAKGYSCTVDSYPGSPIIPIFLTEKRVVITPLGKRLRFGGTLELAGDDLRLNPARYQAVINAGREALNESLRLTNEEAWSGLRPLTPDGLPIIDRVPGIKHLIVATGHAMLGFTQSPITGKLVAELANGQSPSIPLVPFRLNRF